MPESFTADCHKCPYTAKAEPGATASVDARRLSRLVEEARKHCLLSGHDVTVHGTHYSSTYSSTACPKCGGEMPPGVAATQCDECMWSRIGRSVR